MASFQQTIIIGHVGRNPDMKYLQDGTTAVCNFSVAVSEKWNDKSSGEQREKTTWYKVAAWRKLAELCNEYVCKGMLVQVIGNVAARGYTGNDGEVKASLELTARGVTFLSSKQDDDVDRDFDDEFDYGGGSAEDVSPF